MDNNKLRELEKQYNGSLIKIDKNSGTAQIGKIVKTDSTTKQMHIERIRSQVYRMHNLEKTLEVELTQEIFDSYLDQLKNIVDSAKKFGVTYGDYHNDIFTILRNQGATVSDANRIINEDLFTDFIKEFFKPKLVEA